MRRIPSGSGKSGLLDWILFRTNAIAAARLAQKAPSSLASVPALYAAVRAFASTRDFLVATRRENEKYKDY
jgi:hypothetical protein